MEVACICFLAVVLWCGARAEKVLGVETDEFDFDGLPGAQHEFKVEIGPGKEDCYYQRVMEGGNLYVSYEVLRGGDGEISMFLMDPELNAIVKNTEKAIRGGFTYESKATTRNYAVCLDNSDALVASKLVFFYLVSYVDEEWSLYEKELNDVHLTVGNFSTSVDLVKDSVTAALMKLAESRMHVMRDWYLIMRNNSYIQHWSILQCVVIMCSSCFQVYFVRRLFRNVNVIPKRPKA